MTNYALHLIATAKKEKSKVLDLGNCALTALPEEVFELVWLEELYLFNTYWDRQEGKWINSKNTLSPNALSEIPKDLNQLQGTSESIFEW